MFLSTPRPCHPVAYYSSMLPCVCLLLANAAMFFITFGGRLAVVETALSPFIISSGPHYLTFRGHPVVVYYFRGGRLAAVYRFSGANLFITFRGRPAVYCSPMPPCWPRRCLVCFGAALSYYSPMPPCYCLLLGNAAFLLFIPRQCRPVVVYYFSGPPRCCSLFANAALPLSIVRQCRPVVVYYFSGVHCCYLLFKSALPLFILLGIRLVYYSSGPPCCCLLLASAAPLLFIARRWRPVVAYCSSGLPCCCLLLANAALLLSIARRCCLAVAY